MLLTLEQESKRQQKPMPSPERLEKVTSVILAENVTLRYNCCVKGEAFSGLLKSIFLITLFVSMNTNALLMQHSGKASSLII